MHLLGECRDDIVVVGGWVPQLILPLGPIQHVGSIDVDIALSHRNLPEAGYATIQALLLRRGYEQDPRQPFIFHRTVVVNGNAIKVEVDFLAGEYEGTGRKHRTQPVHEGRARKARGCDLAFDLFVETEIEGDLPEGGRNQTRIRVSSVVALLVMNGMALLDQLSRRPRRARRTNQASRRQWIGARRPPEDLPKSSHLRNTECSGMGCSSSIEVPSFMKRDIDSVRSTLLGAEPPTSDSKSPS